MSQPLFDQILQIGIVVTDVDLTVASYRELLGLHEWHINYVDTDGGKGKNFRNGKSSIAAKAKIAWISLGSVELEIIEPQDDASVYSQFLKERGPGIHHVMFATPDYEGCAQEMAANNVPVLGSGELQQTRFQMFDTQESLGLICEIAEGKELVPDESL